MKPAEPNQEIEPACMDTSGTKPDQSKYSAYKKKPATRLRNLVDSQGLGYPFRKAFFRYVFKVIKPLVSEQAFRYQNKILTYENASYNDSFANERTVELPIAISFLASNDGRTLEIGNVLFHYATTFVRDIVDKYESGMDVINMDILEYNCPERYDLIVSLSTIEHIGFDESIRDRTKVNRSLEHVISNLLAPDGKLLVSFPLGYNSDLDSDLIAGRLPFTEITIMKRTGWRNHWIEIPLTEQTGFTYGNYLGADYIAVGYYTESNGAL